MVAYGRQRLWAVLASNCSYFVAMRVELGISASRQGFVRRYVAAGISISDPRWHRHDELELNLILRGQARILVGESVYEARPQHLVWLFPGQEHLIAWRSEDFALWVAVFRPELVREQARLLATPWLCRDDPGPVFNRRIAAEQAGALRHDLERLSEPDLPEALFNLGLHWLMGMAWRVFQHADAADAADRVHPVVLEVVRRLQDGDEGPLSDLAAAVGVSPAWLSRLCHRELGCTLVAYRNRLRLQRFLDRYGRGEAATDAALAAGFNSYSQFAKVFRASLGCSPRAWLQRGEGMP